MSKAKTSKLSFNVDGDRRLRMAAPGATTTVEHQGSSQIAEIVGVRKCRLSISSKDGGAIEVTRLPFDLLV